MQKRQGFSRGELCGLAAMTSVLGALLLPVIGQAYYPSRNEAKKRDLLCFNNMKAIAVGLQMYIQDSDLRYPVIKITPGSATGSPAFGWADALNPYIKVLRPKVKTTEVFQCPSEKHRGQTDPRVKGYSDYWYNGNLNNLTDNLIANFATTIVAGEGDGASPDSNARYNINALPKSWLSSSSSPAQRHGLKGMYAFADGHVACLSPQQIGTNKARLSVR